MNFCDDCDSLIKPKKDDNGIVRDYCGDCGEFKGEETSESTGSIAIPNEAREELEEDPEGAVFRIKCQCLNQVSIFRINFKHLEVIFNIWNPFFSNWNQASFFGFLASIYWNLASQFTFLAFSFLDTGFNT